MYADLYVQNHVLHRLMYLHGWCGYTLVSISVTYYSLVKLTKLRLCHTRYDVHTQAKGHM